MREAAEQSRRGKLPRLAPALFLPAACDQAAQRGTGAVALGRRRRAFAAQCAAESRSDKQTSRQATSRQGASTDRNLRCSPAPGLPVILQSPAHPFSVALFSGPEGGFSASEFETALRYDMIAVTLGPRTLRAETAPIVATAAILYEMGDLE